MCALRTQIAKAMGAKVVAVCRGEAKAAALAQLGADAVVDTSRQPDTPLRALIRVLPFVPPTFIAACIMLQVPLSSGSCMRMICRVACSRTGICPGKVSQ